MENTKFKIIGVYNYSAEAFIFKSKLEANGIAVFIKDNFTIDADPLYSQAIGGVKIYVHENEFDKAKKILSEINPFSVDDNFKNITCPKCGEAKVELVTTIKDYKSFLSFLISSLFSLLPFYVKEKYKCSICGFEFDKK
ncbi:putative signal transducing protein [Flavobacterium croceum DSM 17960]|uniref:Putative signal transducing protein n=1 Tax=Flavobacterium croceum DSM 17960 TaxID=1121886 RepID=A0A2S4NB62_9FLAO|nr:DUF2007 domain-containing protein [Flavobacterium croceum]POS02939.1 putative signal transducing protein [Flavobacterium croceum DSM 17960]